MKTSSETYLTVRDHADALAREAYPHAWENIAMNRLISCSVPYGLTNSTTRPPIACSSAPMM